MSHHDDHPSHHPHHPPPHCGGRHRGRLLHGHWPRHPPPPGGGPHPHPHHRGGRRFHRPPWGRHPHPHPHGPHPHWDRHPTPFHWGPPPHHHPPPPPWDEQPPPPSPPVKETDLVPTVEADTVPDRKSSPPTAHALPAAPSRPSGVGGTGSGTGDTGLPDGAQTDADTYNEFLCPITLEVMKDPVIAADGYTYERSAIEQWQAEGNTTSPMTNIPLPHFALIPNRNLKMLIHRHLSAP